MARARTAKHPRPIEPEDESQEPPEEQAASEATEPDETITKAEAPSKAAIVREAMDRGMDDLGDIAAFASGTYGVEIKRPQISAYKSQARAKERKGEEDHHARKPTLHPKPAAPVIIPPDLFDDLKRLREIRDKYGDGDWGKMIEAIG